MAEQNKPHKTEQSSHNSGKNKGLSTKQKILIGLSFLLLVAIIGVLLFALLYKPPTTEPISIVTEDNRGSIAEDLDKKVADGMFEIKMNTDWSFETATSPSSNAYIANSINNTRTINFDLTLVETGEIIFTSPYMPLGTQLNEVILDKELPVGIHEAKVNYHLVDETYKVLSSVSVSVNLSVLK